MPERPDDFEEAWARIVADLTSGSGADGVQPVGGDGSGPSGAEGPGRTAADGLDRSGADPDRGAPSGGHAMGSPAGDESGEADGAPSDPGSTGGLAALFEPLRRAAHEPDTSPEPGAADPGAFVDSWQDEGHFTPPEPPELPEGTPMSRLAWAGLLGGPTTLALLALTGWPAPRIVGIAAGLATLAGFVTLVWLLPDSREDGWDDGARL